MKRAWGVAAVVAAGCGRIGFGAEPRSDAAAVADSPGDVPEGHDEDGDGVPDAVDVCPHVPDDQTDADGDGVGAACDPDDTVPGHAIALFDPMLELDPDIEFVSGSWSLGDDAIELNSTGFSELRRNFAIADADVWIGLDVVEVAGARQHLLIHPSVNSQPLPRYYVQMFREDGLANHLSVIQFDGGYLTLDEDPLPPSGISTGPIEMRLSARTAPASLALRAVAEPSGTFSAGALTPNYAGSPAVRFAAQGVRLRVRYQCVITLP